MCGQVPVVNVDGTYWLCGGCVLERLGDAQDAARYKWLRDSWDGSVHPLDREIMRDGGKEMDAAIDDAMLTALAKSPTK